MKGLDTEEQLWERSWKHYPESATLRERWVRAVQYLRSGRGWALDRMVTLTVNRPLLHGYVATPENVVHSTLPDAVVIPGGNIEVGPWAKKQR